MCQGLTYIRNKWTQHNARIAACICNASFEFRSWRSVSARTSMRPRRLGGFALSVCEYHFLLWLEFPHMTCMTPMTDGNVAGAVWGPNFFPVIWESAWQSCTILHQVDLAKRCTKLFCLFQGQNVQLLYVLLESSHCRKVLMQSVMSLADPKISQLNSSKNICSTHAFKQ